MSTIASLISLIDPSAIKPWSEGMQSVNREQIGRQQAQTGLLELADLKAKQQAEQDFLLAIKNNPALAQQLLGGGPVLGSLGTAQPPGAGPMTQQQVMPGQPPGAPQPVPGGQDLSQFATQGAPPSTLASLGPAGQPQMQAPPNPVLAMAAQNPRAALMLQQQLEQRQDLAMKRQEQQLEMGVKVLGYVGQQAQGVTDQAALDALRSDLQSQGLGKYAAQLPQLYSKEAMAPFIAKALDVKEALTLQVQDLTAQAAVIRARKEGRSVDVDNQLRAMGVQPGEETPAQIKEALQAVEDAKVRVSAAHGSGQIVQTPGGAARIGKDNQVEYLKGPQGEPIYPKPTAEEQRAASYGDRAKAAHETAVTLEKKGLTPGIWSKVGEALPFGLGNYLVGEDQQRYRQTVNQFAQAILRKESGAAISPTEYTMTERTYFPQPGDAKKVIAQKSQERERVIQSMQEEGKQTGRTDTQGQPQSQSSPGTGKPVSQMTAEETRAEIAAIKARGGR